MTALSFLGFPVPPHYSLLAELMRIVYVNNMWSGSGDHLETFSRKLFRLGIPYILEVHEQCEFFLKGISQSDRR